MAYATLEELRRTLQSGALTPGSGDDDLLGMYLEDAQQLLDDWTHRTFEAPTDTTRRFDALADVVTLTQTGDVQFTTRGRTLWLGDDLCQITSVVNGDGTTVSASDYVTEPRNADRFYALTLKSGANVTWTYEDSPENAIAITGRWAFSVTADALIRGATLSLAAWAYRQRSNQTGDADRPLVTGDGVTILPAVLPKHVFERLAMRRRVV